MGFEFIVKTEKVAWATKAINRYIPQLEEEDVMDILSEVERIKDCLSFSEEGELQMNLTDLQMVAFAAALSAAGEIIADAGG